MKIDRLNQLFGAKVSPSAQTQNNNNIVGNENSKVESSRLDDAVTVSTALTDGTEVSRAAKVTTLASQIERGTYSVSSENIAKVLWRDLF